MMTMAPTATDAPITSPPSRWWRCACGRTLGEIVNGRVVIKVGDRRLSLPVVAGLDQVCPKCGAVSRIEAA